MKKLHFPLLAAMAGLLFLTACKPEKNVAVTGVTISPATLTIVVGDEETLQATVAPVDATNKNVTWNSDDETIATVDHTGKVTAVAPGTTTITVTTVEGKKSDECTVTVEPAGVRVTKVELNKETLTLTVGDDETLEAVVSPGDAANKNVTWKSDDEAIASVDGAGKVTAVAPGQTTITVTTVDGEKTDDCTVIVEPIPVVYVAGNENNGTGQKATLWIDGVATQLSDSESNAASVFVLGDDVYVAGMVFNENYMRVATLWKNGVPQALSDKTTITNSVFVSNDDVYIAGIEYAGRNVPYARYWKNGTMSNINEGSYSNARSVFVSDGDVYVAGDESTAIDESAATLWVNGEMQTLSTVYSFAYSVFVSDGDVYVAGYEYNASVPCATIWKNGVKQILDDGTAGSSYAYGVSVSGDDVYATGYKMVDLVRKAMVWKNGTPQTISETESWPNAIATRGDDVYVAGYAFNAAEQSIATLWVNGTPEALSENVSTANSIFVK